MHATKPIHSIRIQPSGFHSLESELKCSLAAHERSSVSPPHIHCGIARMDTHESICIGSDADDLRWPNVTKEHIIAV